MTISGFGTGPFASTPVGSGATVPESETRSSLSSSRKINGITKRYVTNDEGGFESMDDIQQTVLLRIAFAEKQSPFNAPADHAKMKTDIRNALADMAAKPDPLIQIKSIDVTDGGGGTVYKRVVYKNLLTGTINVVEPD